MENKGEKGVKEGERETFLENWHIFLLPLNKNFVSKL